MDRPQFKSTDSLNLVGNVRRRLTELALSTNFVRDERVANACRSVWSDTGAQGGLVSELWVEGAFTSESSEDTLQSLADSSIMDQGLVDHLKRSDVFPADRRLYRHQSKALRTANSSAEERPTLVVSAGTGAGKTEAFLLPILNDLWRNPRRDGETGMRCLMLYPMNALVVERVERWLKDNDKGLRVFHFTSETPEDDNVRKRRGEPKSSDWRIRTRKEARQDTPDIVITNYSMLEYMLCRPQDDAFFGPGLRTIVLDEAHFYAGVPAAEITMLLRRVRLRCGVKPDQLLQIATSATLGGDKHDLESFAATVFSAKPEKTIAIFGSKTKPSFATEVDPRAATASSAALAQHAAIELRTLDGDSEFVEDSPEQRQTLRAALRGLVSEPTLEEADSRSPSRPAPFLHDALSRSRLVRQAAEKLHSAKGALALDDLAGELFSRKSKEAELATVALLRLCASAREKPDLPPLIPHRLHFLARAAEGLCACLNPGCAGPEERRLPKIGCLQPLSEKCRYCESATLAVHRCDVCGEWALASWESPLRQLLLPLFEARPARRYFLVEELEGQDFRPTIVDPLTGDQLGDGEVGVKLFAAPCPEHGADCFDWSSCRTQHCPRCDVKWSAKKASNGGEEDDEEEQGECSPIRGSDSLARSVLAETLLEGMATFPDETRNWKPAGGRRLLCFSDSRREAARLGPQLTRQHERLVIRAAIADAAKKLGDDEVATDVESEIEDLDRRLANPNLNEQQRMRFESKRQGLRSELQQARAGQSFADFATSVARDDRISQVFDRDLGEKHQADDWNQLKWERNRDAIKERMEVLVATELNRRLPTKFSLESAGLVEVAYPDLDQVFASGRYLGTLPTALREAVEKIWPDYLAALLDTLRFDGVCGWSEGDPPRTNHLWDDESPLWDRWAARDGSGWRSIRFVGASEGQLRRWFTSEILEKAGCAADKVAEASVDLLCEAFDALFKAAADQRVSWLKVEPTLQLGPNVRTDRGLKILLEGLSVRAPKQLFACPDSLTLWPRNVLGWAPLRGCRGGLTAAGQTVQGAQRRWERERKELSEPVFRMGLWGEEHSAQIDATDNRRLQDLFKAGVRNILSSTTTMELGIDIGGLNGVMLGNTPPGPANHRQRAGRAGRRSDGSSVVATFTQARLFDREVFHNFGTFLARELRRPVAHLDRERVVRRHIHALLLGEFFRRKALQKNRTGAMDAYSSMGAFCYSRTPPRWEREPRKPLREAIKGHSLDKAFQDWLSHPADLPEDLADIVRVLSKGTALEAAIAEPGGWLDLQRETSSTMERAVGAWRGDYETLQNAWEAVAENPGQSGLNRSRNEANALRYQIQLLTETTVIEWLADNRFLPRYGFPINLQRLEVRRPDPKNPDRSRQDDRVRLQRSSLLALGEYVPGAKVLAGGRTATSRGLLKYWTETTADKSLGHGEFLITCANKHLYLSRDKNKSCPECDEEALTSQMLLLPRYGYLTAAWEPPTRRIDFERVVKRRFIRSKRLLERSSRKKPISSEVSVTSPPHTTKSRRVYCATRVRTGTDSLSVRDADFL